MVHKNPLDPLQLIREWEITTHTLLEHHLLTVLTLNDLWGISRAEQEQAEQVIHSSSTITSSSRTIPTCNMEREEWRQEEWAMDLRWEEGTEVDTEEILMEEWEWEEWRWAEWGWEWEG